MLSEPCALALLPVDLATYWRYLVVRFSASPKRPVLHGGSVMPSRNLFAALSFLFSVLTFTVSGSGQGIPPYPNALTDRLIHQETPMAPPPRNVVFADPDFGSLMVRATDSTTNFKLPGTFLRTEASGEQNEWSADTKKFYVTGKGGQVLAFAFDPSSMAIGSLPNAGSGQGLLLPLSPGPTFSFVDPDLIYGTTSKAPLTITSYRFSTGLLTPVIDTTACGLQPPLSGHPVSDEDVSLSLDDSRVSVSVGGSQSGKQMFVVVYDKSLGCRWFNTQTGQIGGQWGPSGSASISTSYLIRHAYLARSGSYVHILTDIGAWYVWDLATLNLTSCIISYSGDCTGYGVEGYNNHVNGPAVLDDMQVVMRPYSDLTQITSLFYPIPSPPNWGQSQHFTWSNVNVSDTTPVCGSTYSYDGDMIFDQPFGGEIFCVETDGLASTVWRFAHNRASYITPYFQTQPLGNVSMDGSFYLFTSDWDAQLGIGKDGTPLSDVYIVKLD